MSWPGGSLGILESIHDDANMWTTSHGRLQNTSTIDITAKSFSMAVTRREKQGSKQASTEEQEEEEQVGLDPLWLCS